MITPIHVFVSYAREDENARVRLLTCLKPLMSSFGLMVHWDGTMKAGVKWKDWLRETISQSSYFIALVSPDYVASDVAYLDPDSEFNQALTIQAHIIPIVVQSTDLGQHPNISNLNHPGTDSKPARHDDDEAWKRVSIKLRELWSPSSPGPGPTPPPEPPMFVPVCPANLTAYLEWVQRTNHLIESNMAGIENWSLEDIHVPLTVERRQGNVVLAKFENVAEFLRTHKRAALLGEPGQGKTTSIRHLAWFHAGALLNAGCNFGEGSLLPIVIYAEVLASRIHQLPAVELTPARFVDCLNSILDSHIQRFPDGWLRERLDKGEAIVLLDSLDAVSDEDRQKIGELIRAASDRWNQSRWLVTSRRYAWERDRIAGFDEGVVCEMTPQEVEHYVCRWIEKATRAFRPDENVREGKRGLTPSEIKERTKKLQLKITQNQVLRELTRRPKFLAAICSTDWARGELPSGRHELYEKITDGLIDSRPVKDLDADQRRNALAFIALFMLQSTKPTMGDAKKIAEALGRDVRFSGWQVGWSDFPKSEAMRSGLLLEPPDFGGMVKFYHPSFQEFFAARELASRSDIEWGKFVQGHATDEAFLEVLRFLAGEFIRRRHGVLNEFVQIVVRGCPGTTVTDKAKALAGISRVFQDTGFRLEELEAYRKLYEEVKRVLFAKPPLLAIADRSKAMSVWGQIMATLPPDFIGISPGVITIGSQRLDTEQPNFDSSATDSAPVLRVASGGFEMSVFPVTVQEYQHFVLGAGYARESESLWTEAGRRWLRSQGSSDDPDRSAPKYWRDQLKCPTCPVTFVSLHEATAFAAWKSAADNDWDYSVPTELEWEFAVRRADSIYQPYTYGEHPPREYSAFHSYRDLCPVGVVPEDETASGLRDISGNVADWTLSAFDPYPPVPPITGGCYVARDYGEVESATRVIRGGTMRNYDSGNRTAIRHTKAAGQRFEDVGFRLLRRPKPVSIKKRRPSHHYPFELADFFAADTRSPRNRAQLDADLSTMHVGLGALIIQLIDQLFPADAQQRWMNRKALPCRLGDNPDKLRFNLRYQDSRIKVSVDEAPSNQCASLAALRLRAVSATLTSQLADVQLWTIVNDNDLDAIVFGVLDAFDPAGAHVALAQGAIINSLALAALPPRDELAGWTIDWLVRYQVFAGVRLLNNQETTRDRQFGKFGRFEYFDVAKFEALVAKPSARLLFLLDDNGELVWDLALIRMLLERFPNLTVTAVTSTMPIGNNACRGTVEVCLRDPKLAPLPQLIREKRLEIIYEPSRRSTIDFECASGNLTEALNHSTLFLLKGVAAFETLQRLPRPCFYAFVVHSKDSQKCTGLEADTGVFVAVAAGFSCYEYGDTDQTLIRRLPKQ